MKRPVRILVSLLLGTPVAGAAVALHAQTDPLQGATRVRALTQERQWLVGTVAAVRGDTLVLRADPGAEDAGAPAPPPETRLLLSSLAQLQASAGFRSRSSAGAAVGFIGAALIGGAIAYVLCANAYDCPRRPTVLAGGGLAGLAGALIGRSAGSSMRVEQWRALPVPARRSAPEVGNAAVLPGFRGGR